MAKMDTNMEENLDEQLQLESEAPKQKSGGINPKVFLIGLPLFILQLVIVYFVTANILLSKVGGGGAASLLGGGSEETTTEAHGESGEEKYVEPEHVEVGKHIHTVEDVIINPAETGGDRLLLVSIGVDVQSEEQLTILGERQMLIKDLIINTLSAKTLDELSTAGSKEILKQEIIAGVQEMIPSIRVNNIYFSKYVIN